MRPEKYESVSKPVTNAWGKNSNGVPSAWGQQPKERGKSNFLKSLVLLLF